MSAVDPALQDPLLSLRRAIAAGSLPTATTSSELSSDHATEDLAQATHLFFSQPVPQSIALTTPTRFVSASTSTPVDLRSIFFAWQKKDVAIPDYIASAQELNEALKQKEGDEAQVQNLVFVERLDLITWLEGASDESEYIKPLEGAAAAAEAAAAVAGTIQSDAAAGIASGAARASAQGGAGAAPTGAQGSRAQKQIDPRLQEIYNGERKTGDRNTVLHGIKPTDFSHIRKSAEVFHDKNRNRPGQQGAKPGVKSSSVVPAPSAGLPLPSRKSNSRPDPIILLSPSASSPIRMSNIKSFLGEGVYVPPDHPTLSMSTDANFMEIKRTLNLKADPSNPSAGSIGSQVGRSSKPTKFILVDGTTNFKPEYWSRLVAVFTTGQTWQFKSYKWSSPPELFKHAQGIFVKFRGEDTPEAVTSWGSGVASFPIARWDDKLGVNGPGRWKDQEVVESIWMAIEESMKLRGWGSK
ncbi:hypothetical protein N7532_000587 [Penicillium argentinense]|uniref:Cell division control protein 73 C-terminal domain-containing protein n=1 Tax=Penicillium argentinense TaxID=1131581 RepID=A0A9W9G5T2_9EURO|nr:uncharacterized protein N7532_000587 [Penicillium argentinense]KAJ5112542.1 hypothetical protein N7532_000587 [Penicillium argentinense]